MRGSGKALVLCAAFGAAAGLRAEEATPQGAARLTETLQTYLGRGPGVVTVIAEGATYAVRLDATPLLSPIFEGVGSVRVTPLLADLTERGDGTWDVAMDQAFELEIDVPGQSLLQVSVADVRVTGLFDEDLRTMSRLVADMSGLSTRQFAALPEAGETSSFQTEATAHFEADSIAGAGGGVDSALLFAMTGISQLQTRPITPGAAPVEVDVSMARYQAASMVRGLRTGEVLALLAWLVAHPSSAAIITGQDELRGVLTAALPLVDRMTWSAEGDDILIESQPFAFRLRRIVTEGEVSGIVAEGRFRWAAALEGLALPPGRVPDWATELVPQDLTLDVAVDGFDLAAPAAILIAGFDLTAPEPLTESILGPLTAAFLPEGTVQVALAPGRTASPLFELGYRSDMRLGPAAMPEGEATDTLRGYDAILAALDAAPAEEVAEARQGLGMAWGLAERGDDLLSWTFTLTADGRILLNGMDMGPMLGGQPGAAP